MDLVFRAERCERDGRGDQSDEMAIAEDDRKDDRTPDSMLTKHIAVQAI